MKRTLLIIAGIASILCTGVWANEAVVARTFKEVSDGLGQGAALNVVVDFAKCQNEDQVQRKTVGGVIVTSFIIQPDSTIAFSDHHISVDDHGQSIEEDLRYRLSSDQQLTIAISRRGNFSETGKVTRFVCQLDTGAHLYLRR